MNLSLKEVASMCGGVLSSDSNPLQLIINVVIDSREVVFGTLFVAIKGEKQDGHDYVAACFSQGAAAALVSVGESINLPNLIYVDDTVKALGLLAHNYRLKFNIPLVGITGSNGKTTVKEMLKSICEREFGKQHVLATTGNLNNHLGVPLTLLKLNPEHKVAIIEMGMNHAGELTYLSNLAKPSIAVVNNVLLAHAGFFADLNDIAKAKGEIYSGLGSDGIACINQASPFAHLWHHHPAKTISFATPGSICYLSHSGSNGEITLTTSAGEITTNLQVLGEHNKANAVTAVTLALLLNCNLYNISQGLASYTGYKGRLEKKTAFNDALIIDDSYNANPDSVKAAILAISELPKPHWFIFADLKELGKFTDPAHEEIGLFAANNGIDYLLTVGELSKTTNSVFKGSKMHFESNQDIVEYCKENLPKGATLLVKGSNSMHLAQVVAKLIK